MLVREYLSTLNKNTEVTFIKARARKDAHTPYYHAEYQTTPICYVWEWSNPENAINDYYILNHKQPPIDWLSGADWNSQFERGQLKSMLVISKEDLEKLYSPKQAQDLVVYIEEKIKADK